MIITYVMMIVGIHYNTLYQPVFMMFLLIPNTQKSDSRCAKKIGKYCFCIAIMYQNQNDLLFVQKHAHTANNDVLRVVIQLIVIFSNFNTMCGSIPTGTYESAT